jgi:hypothetical protein
MQNKKIRHKNNLLEARRRAGLEPKQVSFLLNKKTTDELHMYERGDRLPLLETLFRLAIIYATPPHFLYQAKFQELKKKITKKRKKHPHLFPERAWFPPNAESLKQEEHCFYAEILKTRVPTALEIEAINRHILDLNNTLIDYKQGRSPFSL